MNKIDSFHNKIDDAYSFFKKNYYSDKTNQFYDFRTSDDINKTLNDLPTLEEVKKQWPNFVGWGTGMEDNNITASYMLLSALSSYQMNKKEETVNDIHNFVKGLLLNAEISSQTGFLVRNVHPEDCKSHYINSSRDQYTYWIFSMSRYLNSELATTNEKERIKKALINFAIKAEKDVVEANDYCLTKEDGTPAVASSMLKGVMPAEALRLPMIYLAAYKVSLDSKWLNLYKNIREETFSVSERVDVSIYKEYIIALIQMMVSMDFIFDNETEEFYKKRLLDLMKRISDGVMELVRKAHKRINEFHNLNNKIDYLKPFRENSSFNAGRLWGYGYDLYVYTPVADAFGELAIPPRVIAEGMMIQALCPDRDVPEEQLEIFYDTLSKIKLNGAAFYYPSYYIGCYWLLRNKLENGSH